MIDGNTTIYSSSAPVVTSTVSKANSSTFLTVSPTELTVGQTLIQVAIASGQVFPTGFVTFFDGSMVVGQSPIDATGYAQFSTSTLGVGTHSLTARYAGDATLLPSVSNSITLVVNPVPVVVTVLATGPQLTRLMVTFNVPLDLGRAQDRMNYRVSGLGGRVGALASAKRSADGLTVTLTLRNRLLANRTYNLDVVGTLPRGLISTKGVALNAAGRGLPGSNFHTTFSLGVRPRAVVRRAAHR